MPMTALLATSLTRKEPILIPIVIASMCIIFVKEKNTDSKLAKKLFVKSFKLI